MLANSANKGLSASAGDNTNSIGGHIEYDSVSQPTKHQSKLNSESAIRTEKIKLAETAQKLGQQNPQQ
jgi:hypothetical protein